MRKAVSGKLPRGEWDFAGVPDAELDACFYYEYARASDLIRAGIAEWRKCVPTLAKIQAEWLGAPTSTWAPGNIRHTDEREFHAYVAAMIAYVDANALKPTTLGKVDSRISDLVSSLSEFPDVCWQSLRNSALKSALAKSFKVPDSNDAAQNPQMCLADFTSQLFKWHQFGFSAWEVIQKATSHTSNAQLSPSFPLFCVSWNYRDEELLAAFDAWLKKNRPSHFPEPDRIRKTIGISWQRLPFGKRTALEYLGVYRRKQMCACTWPEFVELWPETSEKSNERRRNANIRTEGEPEKAAALSRISQLKGQCADAKEMISFIEGG